jgi:SAM-dependent methyltransferase
MGSSSSAERRRTASYGERRPLGLVDRFGVWLSVRAQRRRVETFAGARVGDFGCGYDAKFVRSILDEVAHAVLVDVTLALDLKEDRRITAIEGALPGAVESLEDKSLDVVLCISVLEHLWDPLQMLREIRRVCAPGGTCLVNVPSWRGKWFLELSAFRLNLSPPEEMDDHKTYYDPRDLWPLLVRAGFLPHEISCFKHKFGLNTFAVCRVSSA